MRGQFIVFEGIDGSGKSTQLMNLASWLPISGLMPKDSRLICTKEPGGTVFGEKLRDLLLHPRKDIEPFPMAELLLYAADRAQHVESVISPSLQNGDWVLCDRYTGSTLAYQGYGRGLGIKNILLLEEIATSGIISDITLFLKVSIENSFLRRKNITRDRIEATGVEFLRRVANGFDEIGNKRGWNIVSADEDPEIVGLEIKNILRDRFCGN